MLKRAVNPLLDNTWTALLPRMEEALPLEQPVKVQLPRVSRDKTRSLPQQAILPPPQMSSKLQRTMLVYPFAT
jgi:hypothetical protein